MGEILEDMTKTSMDCIENMLKEPYENEGILMMRPTCSMKRDSVETGTSYSRQHAKPTCFKGSQWKKKRSICPR